VRLRNIRNCRKNYEEIVVKSVSTNVVAIQKKNNMILWSQRTTIAAYGFAAFIINLIHSPSHAMIVPNQQQFQLHQYDQPFLSKSHLDRKPSLLYFHEAKSILSTISISTNLCLALILGSPLPSTASIPSPESSVTLEKLHNQDDTSTNIWELNNGQVKLPDLLQLTINNHNHNHPSEIKIKHPILLGSGGGGAVFSANANLAKKDNAKVAIKVSWSRSTKSVKNECEVLQSLENTHVRNVETCLGQFDYPYDDQNRVMIVLTPVVEDDPVASLSEINQDLWKNSIHSIISTLIDILASNVITVDVQPLISKRTGDVLFIDFTEAKVISSTTSKSSSSSFMDLALVSSFCNEMMALIPSSNDGNDGKWQEFASKAFLEELKLAQERGIEFSQEIFSIFSDQSVLVSYPPTLEFIESKTT